VPAIVNKCYNTLGFPSEYKSEYESNLTYVVVDGWAFTFGTARMGTGWGPSPLRLLLVVPIVTAHPSTASVPITIAV